jgi:AcrR family transcriptional regulator
MLSTVPEEKTTSKRPYRMGARAKSTAATAEKILDAADAVFDKGPIDDFTLNAVAERAGIPVQTILRHFGNRRGLLIATLGRTALEMGRDRKTPVDDPPAAIDTLVDHYDKYGDRILRLLATEERNRALHLMVDSGRNYHRRWCEKAFRRALSDLRGAPRERRVAQLVAVTDIYTWKIMRRDRGLSGRQTKLAMRELLEPLTEHER